MPRNCPITGSPLPETKGEKGRPRDYASTEASHLQHRLCRIEELLVTLEFTPAAAKRMRIRLFAATYRIGQVPGKVRDYSPPRDVGTCTVTGLPLHSNDKRKHYVSEAAAELAHRVRQAETLLLRLTFTPSAAAHMQARIVGTVNMINVRRV